MRGEIVIIRAFGGQPLIRRIWEIDNKVVYVTDDSRQNLISLGFPREDVFKYDPKIAESMEQLYKSGKWAWNKLVPF